MVIKTSIRRYPPYVFCTPQSMAVDLHVTACISLPLLVAWPPWGLLPATRVTIPVMKIFANI
jgi:hypothetical protein